MSDIGFFCKMPWMWLDNSSYKRSARQTKYEVYYGPKIISYYEIIYGKTKRYRSKYTNNDWDVLAHGNCYLGKVYVLFCLFKFIQWKDEIAIFTVIFVLLAINSRNIVLVVVNFIIP